MRKGLLWVGALAVAMTMWTTGCTERKADMADTLTADTLISDDTTAVDTMERLLAEQPMPKAADELI